MIMIMYVNAIKCTRTLKRLENSESLDGKDAGKKMNLEFRSKSYPLVN